MKQIVNMCVCVSRSLLQQLGPIDLLAPGVHMPTDWQGLHRHLKRSVTDMKLRPCVFRLFSCLIQTCAYLKPVYVEADGRQPVPPPFPVKQQEVTRIQLGVLWRGGANVQQSRFCVKLAEDQQFCYSSFALWKFTELKIEALTLWYR